VLFHILMRKNQEPVFFDTESLGVYAYRDKLITIQVRWWSENRIWTEWELGEKGMIDKFYEFTGNEIVRKQTKFVGFNNIEHDVPFLLERLHHQKYSKQDFEFRFERFHRHLAYIDMRQLLGHSVGNFAKWKKLFTGDTFDYAGDMIPKLYEKGEYTKILEYVNDELIHFEKVYDLIKKEPFYNELQKLRGKFL